MRGNGGIMPEEETFAARMHVGGIELVHFEQMRPRLSDGYLIKGLLASGSMAVIFGEKGSGKTFLALHMGLCVAGGMEMFGHRVRQCGVVYIAAEAGRGIENRVAAAKHEVEFPETMPFAAITCPVDLCTQTADVDAIIDAIEFAELGMPVGLVVIDTLSRVMAGGNENQPDHMGALVRNIDRIRADTGAAVVIVHHAGKDTSRGARGHSLLGAATDTELEVSNEKGTCTARVTKQRELPTEGSLCFTLRSVDIGIDHDGDRVTSCVVDETTGIGPDKPKERQLPKAAARALVLLHEAIDTGGEIPPASNHIPPGKRCATESVWREYCYKGGIATGERRAHEQAFKRSAETLLDAGRIGKWEQWVWTTQ